MDLRKGWWVAAVLGQVTKVTEPRDVSDPDPKPRVAAEHHHHRRGRHRPQWKAHLLTLREGCECGGAPRAAWVVWVGWGWGLLGWAPLSSVPKHSSWGSFPRLRRLAEGLLCDSPVGGAQGCPRHPAPKARVSPDTQWELPTHWFPVYIQSMFLQGQARLGPPHSHTHPEKHMRTYPCAPTHSHGNVHMDVHTHAHRNTSTHLHALGLNLGPAL